MAAYGYRYELRRGDEIVATGHLSWQEPLQVGDRITIGELPGIVRAVEPILGEHEQRLLVRSCVRQPSRKPTRNGFRRCALEATQESEKFFHWAPLAPRGIVACLALRLTRSRTGVC
jgi:hypothetical protein